MLYIAVCLGVQFPGFLRIVVTLAWGQNIWRRLSETQHTVTPIFKWQRKTQHGPPLSSWSSNYDIGLFKMTVWVLTTVIHNTLQIAVYVFFIQYNNTPSFCYTPYSCSICAPFVTLQTSTRQSSSFRMSAVTVSMSVQIRTFSSRTHTHPVSWNCAYRLRVELSDGSCFQNLVGIAAGQLHPDNHFE